MLGVYGLIEQPKAAAAAVTDGHCFPVRLTDDKLESVDNGGCVCDFLQTDTGIFRFEDYDFESKNAVFLMKYMQNCTEFVKK